jgi:plastocyanin
MDDTRNRLTIDNFLFAPAEITVTPGARVPWANRDDIPHTVADAAEPSAFKSPPLDTGDTFSFVFPTPGGISPLPLPASPHAGDGVVK